MSAPDELIAQRYRLTRLVGSGGMGAVWEAFDERLHRTVAVKQLHPQPWLSDAEADIVTNRAMREARITARLNHPHAVPVYDVVEDHGRPCLVMQFLPSEPLSSVLQRRGALPEPEVADLGSQVASALEAAHRVGIVHRDVKPGNVLVTEDGTARISDFGIAHALGDVTLTSTGIVAGTPEYLAPEVARGGEPEFPADIFSLGATLYAAVEGRPPFGTDTNRIALLHRVAAGVINAPKRSGALASLLMQMLAANPGDRPTMSAVAAQLASIRDAERAPSRTSPAAADLTESTALPSTAGLPVPRGADLPATQRQQTPLEDVPTVAASPPWTIVTDRPAPPATTPAAAPTPAVTPAPAETVTSAPPPAPAPAPAPRDPSGSAAVPTNGAPRRWRLVAVLAAVLLIPVLVLILSQREDAQLSAAPPTAAATAATTTGASTSTAPSLPAAAAPPAASPATASTPSATSAAPTVTASGSLTAADSVKAITSYYSVLPGDTDQAWPLMTASYQTNKAGGRQSYRQFWDGYSRVTATDVSAVGASTVQATISYYTKEGRVVRERTSFGLVNDGGVVKINSSQVLSTLGE